MASPVLSVVIPLYNEEETIWELFRRLTAVLERQTLPHEVICVDDGSADQTPALLRKLALDDPRIRVIRLSRNFGHQCAVTAGLDHARGEAVIMMDGDLQDPPELIPDLIQKWRDGFDVVYAVRKRRKAPWWKGISYRMFYMIISRIATDVDLPLNSGDYSLMSRRVVEAICALPERNRYVRGLRSWVGFSQVGVPFERGHRYAGKTKYTLEKLLKLACDGILSFSYAPIRCVTAAGFLVSLVAFVGILAVLAIWLFMSRSIPGFASLAIIVLFLGGIQLLSLGIVGEYIRRIYDESKGRTPYVVMEKIGFDDRAA